MSKPCSLSERPTHWFLGDLLCSPEPVLKGRNVTFNVTSQKKISVKVVLFLIKRVEMGTDAQLAWLNFYLDFLVISPPQIGFPWSPTLCSKIPVGTKIRSEGLCWTGSVTHTLPFFLLWSEHTFHFNLFGLVLTLNGLETKLGLKGLKDEFPKA